MLNLIMNQILKNMINLMALEDQLQDYLHVVIMDELLTISQVEERFELSLRTLQIRLNTVFTTFMRMERLELSRQLRHTILSRTWLPISTPRESSPYIDIDTGTLIFLFFDK